MLGAYTAERATGVSFRQSIARLPGPNDRRNVIPELVENGQFLGKAQGRTLPATPRLPGKDIRDVRVVLRSAHGLKFISMDRVFQP